MGPITERISSTSHLDIIIIVVVIVVVMRMMPGCDVTRQSRLN